MQQFYSDSSILQGAVTLSVLLKGCYSYSCSLWCIQQF